MSTAETLDYKPEALNQTLSFTEKIEYYRGMSGFAQRPEYISSEYIREGYLERYGVLTSAGYTYDVLVGIPRDQKYAVPVLATSAWFTSTHGHNEHAVRNFMREGSPFIFVGPEGSYRTAGQKLPISPLTLTQSTAATLSIAREIANTHHYLMDERKRIVIGESRGAMVGMGLAALASFFDQEVVFSDITAPCFPRHFEIKDAVNFSKHLVREPFELIKVGARLTMRRLIHYPATLDPHPFALAHQLATWLPLRSGEAGDLARLIDNDALMHITTYDDDYASMDSEWRKLFENYPNIRITSLPGSHLTLADPETLQYLIARHVSYHRFSKLPDATTDDIFDFAHTLIQK